MDFEFKLLNKKDVEIVRYLGKEELLIIPSFVFIENKVYKVTSIAKYALNNPYIKKVFIPDSIINIHKLAFLGFKYFNISEIIVDENNVNYCSINGNLYSKDKTILYRYASRKEEETFCVPKGVKLLSSSSFEFSNNLKEIKLPSTLEEIEDYTFSCCENLTNVKLPRNIKKIGDFAFFNCYNLSYIKLPSLLEYIGEGAFVSIGKSLFEIEVSSSNKNFRIYKGGLYDFKKEVIYKYFSSDDVLKLPKTLKKIMPFAFAYTYLNTIVLPSSLSKIGYSAFKSSSIRKIAIPPKIERLDISTFENCRYLNDVYLPSSLKQIDSFAFYNCKNLENLVLPDSLNHLGDSVFSSTKIKKINLPINIQFEKDTFKGSLIKNK